MTDIADLLKQKIHTGPGRVPIGKVSKRRAATTMGISRPALDAWLASLYVPEPEKHYRRLAEFLALDESYILAVLLQQRGIDPGTFGGLATFAKGVYVSSARSMVPAA